MTSLIVLIHSYSYCFLWELLLLDMVAGGGGVSEEKHMSEQFSFTHVMHVIAYV
jgi:hypothetical protein